MIHRTSSSTHFLYGPLSSFLSSFCCLNFSLSLKGRLSGSWVWVSGVVLEPAAGVPACEGAADCAMTTDGRPNDKSRKRVELTLSIGCAILPVRHTKFKVRYLRIQAGNVISPLIF